MKHVVAHDLDQETARKVTQHAFESYAAQFARYTPSLNWISDNRAEVRLSAAGVGIKGTFDLVPHAIEIELEVPLMFRMMRNKAIEIIEREVKEWISKAKAGL